jgi:predicted ribosomally synthesized peptide with nif11-like leader
MSARAFCTLESLMTIASAKAYITRMREDEAFRQTVNACEDETNNWEFLRQNGYEFTLADFKEAQAEIYRDYGITPL